MLSCTSATFDLVDGVKALTLRLIGQPFVFFPHTSGEARSAHVWLLRGGRSTSPCIAFVVFFPRACGINFAAKK